MSVLYGLEYEGKLLGFYVSACPNEDFADTEYHLDDAYNDRPWLTERLEVAQNVAVTKDRHWWENDYQNPANPYAGKCRVVKVTLTKEAA